MMETDPDPYRPTVGEADAALDQTLCDEADVHLRKDL